IPTSIHSVFFVPAGLVVNNAAPTVGGGQPLLWQHLFWFYSHPAVYIMLLPARGMVSDMLAGMCRKPVFGYKPMVYSMAAIAGLGFIVWGHHMFTSGMNPALGMTFMTSTMMIALPSAIKVFN
ncbi:MAG: cbb3-type cytochrome c oxidase subunit I, partial [Planctomyces sp.]